MNVRNEMANRVMKTPQSFILAIYYYGNQIQQDGDIGLMRHIGKLYIVVRRAAPLVRDRHDNFKTDLEEIACNWVKKVQLGQVHNKWHVSVNIIMHLLGLYETGNFFVVLNNIKCFTTRSIWFSPLYCM
jgi:hypothetical protein